MKDTAPEKMKLARDPKYRLAVPVAALVCVIGSGVLHGLQAGRWHDPVVLSRAAERLARSFPAEVPGWRGTPLEISSGELTLAEATAGRAMRFMPDGTPSGADESPVEVTLLCGPHGPIALHPPTVCFRGAGYRQCAGVRRVTVREADGAVIGTFWSTEFERPADGVPEKIRAWWGWSADGVWTAPESARMAFAGTPVLHKLYLVERNVNDADETRLTGFAKSYLPVLAAAVFGPGGK